MFDQLYQSLNQQQKEAVDSLEGPVMVIAGPGTGKTQVLTLRIANILQKTDTPPYAITALTYTEAAAENMISRLAQIIGETAYQVNISTFHSLAGQIIRQYPEKFPHLRRGRPINIIEKIQLIEEILKKGNYFYLKPFGDTSFYVRPLIKALSDLKKESVAPNQLKEIISTSTSLEDKQKKRLKELVRLYREYQGRLKEEGLYDFEDMINEVITLLEKDRELALAVQERTLYLLVDEYQDTNAAQNKLIRQLSTFWGEAANVFVVGDDDQSIFRFQGASRANFLFFKHLFPKTKIISLKTNYRSREEIVLLSQHFIEPQRKKFNLNLGVDKKIEAAKPSPSLSQRQVQLHSFTSLTQEAEFIVQEIKKLLQEGLPPQEIGIIYRENKDAAVYIPFLNKEKIPYVVEGQVNILNQPVVLQLKLLLTVVNFWGQKEAEEKLFNLLNLPFFDLSPTLIGQAFRQARENGLNIFEYYLQREKRFAPIWKIFDQLEKAKKESLRLPLPLFIQNLMDSTGFLTQLMNGQKDRYQLFYLYTFFNQIKNWYRDQTVTSLSQLEEVLETLERHHLSLEAEPLLTNANAVKLTTAHKAKGQEFSVVFIPQFIEKKWSHKIVPNPLKLPPEIVEFSTLSSDPRKEKEEEEERLFYVALTRAKKQVFITVPLNVWSDGLMKKVLPSVFVHRLDEKLISQEEHQDDLQKLEKVIVSLFKPSQPIIPEEDYWRERLKRIKLSPTSLKTYLSCPYQFLLNNLYRLPRVKSANLILGSAIHKALEEWLLSYKDEKNKPSLDQLNEILQTYISREILEDEEKERVIREAKQLLANFYEDQLLPQLEKSQPYKAELDFSQKHVFTPEKVPLTGKVDRIDILDKDSFLVIDYKTGHIPSKKALADPNEDYRRQLTFYSLLLESEPEFKNKKISFALWFIGNRNQKPLFFGFTPSDEEKEQLRQLLAEVWQKIQGLEFSRTGDRLACRRCPYRFHCFPNGLPPKLPLEAKGK